MTSLQNGNLYTSMLEDVKEKIAIGPIVQMARTSALHAGGREFESHWVHKNTNLGSLTRTLPEGVAEIFNIGKKVTNI